MVHLLRMPEVAAGTTEAVLSEWLVEDSAEFAPGDAVISVETDKAVVEVMAEHGAVLVRSLVPSGSSVEVGTPVALLASPGEPVDDVDAALASLGLGPAPSGDGTRPTPEPETGAEGTEQAEQAEETVEVPETADAEPAPEKGQDAPIEHSSADRERRLFISPLARRICEEAGLDPATVEGTGPNGRVRRLDVDRAIETRERAAHPGAADSADAVDEPVVPPTPAGPAATTAATTDDRLATSRPPSASSPVGVVSTPHSRLQRGAARRLAESKQTVPHFYVRGTCRTDELLRLRTALNSEPGVSVSVNDLVVKAVARAHVDVPELNVVWTEDALEQHSQVDVAVAVATERGLLTPVVRNVAESTVSTVARGVRDGVDAAKKGTLRQADLEGGTITVSNLGMYGVEEFSAIINPPHAAILAVGASIATPVVQDGEVRVAQTMRVVLSVDHRAADGAAAARWMAAFVATVENPQRVLL